MHTTRSPTIRASVASHQMSASGESSSEQVLAGFQSWTPDVTSRGESGCRGSWVIVTWDFSYEQTDRRTRLKTIPSHNFVGGR